MTVWSLANHHRRLVHLCQRLRRICITAVSQAWGMWPLMAIYGVYMALTEGVAKALIADHASSDCRGTAMGIFYGLTGLTTLIASLSAGFLWDRLGASAALLLGSGSRFLLSLR